MNHVMHMYLAEVKQSQALHSCFSFHTEETKSWKTYGAVKFSARSFVFRAIGQGLIDTC